MLWTLEMKQQAVDLYNEGYTGAAIEDVMNRTRCGVLEKILDLRRSGNYVFVPEWERGLIAMTYEFTLSDSW